MGEIRMINRVLASIESGIPVTVLLKGWRQRLLLPYVCELMPDALQIPSPIPKPTITSLGWLVRSPWLPQLLGLYKFAQRYKYRVEIKHGSETEILFEPPAGPSGGQRPCMQLH